MQAWLQILELKFEVLLGLKVQIIIFFVIPLCSLVCRCQFFRGVSCPILTVEIEVADLCKQNICTHLPCKTVSFLMQPKYQISNLIISNFFKSFIP